MIEIEKTEKERYDICWTHVHKYSKGLFTPFLLSHTICSDSNEMMLQISYNEVIYSSLRQMLIRNKIELGSNFFKNRRLENRAEYAHHVGN